MHRLFQALSTTNDGAFIINDQNQVVFWNQAAQRILGFTAEEAADRHCYDILGGRDEQGQTLCRRFCRMAIGITRGDIRPNIDLFARTKDGEGRWINVTTFVFVTGDRSLGDMIVHLFRDVTQKKRNERFVEEIEEASNKLLSTNAHHRSLAVPIAFSPDPGLYDLTSRERQVLHLLAHGLSTSEMADTLNISSSTVRNHIQSILRKLDVHSRLEAVTYAYQHNLIDTIA